VLVTDLSQYEGARDLALLEADVDRGATARARTHLRALVARLDGGAWHNLYGRAVRASTLATICSSHDRELVGDSSIRVVANSYPDPGPMVESVHSAPVILFAGHFPYRPNADAAVILAEQVLPRVREQMPDVSLRLVGNPTPTVDALASLPGVTVAGHVPAMGPELRGAAVVAAPMGVVAGTNVKIIEAFAYGVPVVASPAATRGLDVRPGRELEIAETPEALADACVGLLSDRNRRIQLTERARKFYEREHRADAVADDVAGVARAALELRGTPSR
jgi:glycosyltransferase involved in cell wall biosynthesis